MELDEVEVTTLQERVAKLPTLRFDRESVRVFLPQEGWVVYYLLDTAGVILYTGASGRPRGRLLEWVRDAVYPADMVAVERFGSSTAMAKREREVTDLLGQDSFGRRHSAWKARPRKVEV